jgi:hypothetical protein
VFEKALVIAAIVCVGALPVFAKQSSNLAQSGNPFRATEGRNAFARQMDGASNQSLVLHLPAEITADELSKLVFGRTLSDVKHASVDVPAVNNADFQGLVMRQWPGREGVYIGVGSIGKLLTESNSSHAQIYACAFKIHSPHNFEILASLKTPLQFDCDSKDAMTMDGGLDELVSIDAASFKISPSDYAIGLRLGHNEGYSGGIGYQENLLLLMQQGNMLVPIFNHMVYQMQYLAGEWNKDGSRQHDPEERAKFIVAIKDGIKNGFYPIVLKQTIGGHSQFLYNWNSKKMKYELP